MKIPSFLLCMASDVVVVARTFALGVFQLSSSYISPFFLLLPLLIIFLLLLMLQSTWLCSIETYVLHVLFLSTSLIHWFGLKQHHCLTQMEVHSPQIIEEYIWVFWRDILHYSHIPKFRGVLLHDLAQLFLKVMPPDPLVLHIPVVYSRTIWSKFFLK